MKTILRWCFMLLLGVLAILLTVSASILGEAFAANAAPYPAARTSNGAAPGNTAMTGYKDSIQHTGVNSNETILTPGNVNSSQFGRLLSYPVDGQVHAQPLYMPGLTIHGSTHNVVFVATENDTLYAFDADQVGFSVPPLWSDHFGTPVSYTTVSCTDLTPVIGITSTPVIDPSTGILYVVSFTSGLVYKLHAINILTGQEEPGSPTTISGISNFNNLYERQRSSLLFANGSIYMGFSSFCDNQPSGGTYHGFVLRYTYSGSAFIRNAAWNDTPGGSEGGIWGGGGAVAADSSGNIYVMTGNGSFNASKGQYGDSFVKLNANLQVTDYFTPYDQSCLQASDADIGSGGPLVIENSSYTEVVSGGKRGRIYVANTSNMGHYKTVSNPCNTGGASDDTNIKQESAQHLVGGIFSAPTTWSNGTTQYVYVGGTSDHIKAFAMNSDGTLNWTPSSQSSESYAFTGANTFISSNGTSNGIVWATDADGTLRAYDATNLGNELHHSSLGGSYVKFTTPTVANGEVFVGTDSTLDIFGLKPASYVTYAATAAANTIVAPARIAACSACATGNKVGFLGHGGSLQYNSINVGTTGTYMLIVDYIDADAGRSAQMSVNGGSAVTLNFHGSNNNNWNQLQTTMLTVQLNSGANTIKFFNPTAYGPDMDSIQVSPEGNTTASYYLAVSAANTIAAPARFNSCSACTDGLKVGFLGKGGTLQFNGVYVSSASSYTLTIAYVDGDAGRSAQMSVNGGSATTLNFHGTNNSNWNYVQVMTVTVLLQAGNNTIKFSNPSNFAPDIDIIAV